MTKLIDDLKRYEGFRRFPYRDSVGVLTIGIGRNIQEVGISEEEAEYLLVNDIDMCRKQLIGFPWYTYQPPDIRDALVNMCFNMGIRKLLAFNRMLNALANKDYATAAKEALNSMWAREVGVRAQDIAKLFMAYAPGPMPDVVPPTAPSPVDDNTSDNQ